MRGVRRARRPQRARAVRVELRLIAREGPAPHEARGLRGLRGAGYPRAAVPPDPYDPATCERFAEGLGDAVLARAAVLFALLAEAGEVDSVELALALGLRRPQLLAGAVNTHLKLRARALGLPLPFDGGSSHLARGATTWYDRGGTAARMLAALRREQAARG